MNRRSFLKKSALAGAGLTVCQQFYAQDIAEPLSYDELIGKGEPKLYGDGFKLRKQAYDAFVKLSAEALKSDINIQVVSSYRNFSHQNRIWERKYKQYTNRGLSGIDSIIKIIDYSTIPGTSRHHWGTDLDLIDGNVKQPKNVLNPAHFENSGCFSSFKTWMDVNASDFGFYLVYTNTEQRKGFKYEPWHYSYQPLSKSYLSAYRKFNLKDIVTSEKLMGSDHFSEAFITTYYNENILDINPALL
ncbi:MAG: D-alanyl-D-alanine carboxypeptidase family protein [Psychroserpens sp.]|uniref:D-alanyl-D-alanine carboxypeptidase family protein n=1 Tax=Psychroserpens sp. TaxID=2020870 RepID=UPI003C98282C